MGDRLHGFYERLLAVLRRPAVRDGSWLLLKAEPAREGNGSWEGFIAWAWAGDHTPRLLVTVYLSPDQGQCFVRLPFDDLGGHPVRLRDTMSAAIYERGGDELVTRGLYLDVPAYAYHVFEVSQPT